MSDPQFPQSAPQPQPYSQPYPQPQPMYLAQAPGNGMAIAALVLGICGFVLTPIPLFIGLFLGGIPSILAIVFGILGLVRSKTVQRGFAPALVGLILGGLAFLSIFIGAGTIW